MYRALGYFISQAFLPSVILRYPLFFPSHAGALTPRTGHRCLFFFFVFTDWCFNPLSCRPLPSFWFGPSPPKPTMRQPVTPGAIRIHVKLLGIKGCSCSQANSNHSNTATPLRTPLPPAPHPGKRRRVNTTISPLSYLLIALWPIYSRVIRPQKRPQLAALSINALRLKNEAYVNRVVFSFVG